MVIPNGNEEEKENSKIKWVIKKPTNADQNLTPNRTMEPEMNHVAEASTSKNPTTVATPQTNGGISSEGCSCNEGVKPKLVNNLKKNRAKDEKENEQQESTVAPKNSLPWNLRTRRSKCEKANELKKDNKIQRSELKVELTKKEIEEDLKAMLGHPLRGKPKKRPKVVQNQLDNVFPGLNLKGITAKSYKVIEPSS
ncbi:hypothetical protein TanjilG_03564 [Lupinus angustifolius]|uniref:Uncharacterized protein n=1 Tax=Lupinus angustifolius TaxID=3871 RepID=A0A1J7HZ89_LUPAN|nr:PREDICTED: uncharacterized protein LOC109353098 [Lupinus angustifolius]OIW07777.1 hypothetical protein TanjilG_03564 [Lupinus angustifolius]